MFNFDQKNQTAKILEIYARNLVGIDDMNGLWWHEEKEVYSQLPTMEMINKEKSKIDGCVKKIMWAIAYVNQNASDIKRENINEIMAAIFEGCNLDPLTDKLAAITLGNLFDTNLQLDSIDNIKNGWISAIWEWKNDNSTDDSLPENVTFHRLKIGMVIKNYKELCKLLDVEVKDGKSKKLQLEDFHRYFDWEKSGQKFIITDVYDEPLTKLDRRKLGNNSIYVKCIEVILLQYLSEQEGFTRTFTKKNWWEMLGFVNHKYNHVSTKELENLDYTVTPFEIKHFYQRSNKKLEQILFSALNSLSNRKLITYEVQTMIVLYDSYSRKNDYILATDIDKKCILQAERQVLTEMGYEKMIQVFCRFRQKEFYDKVNEIIFEKYGWKYYFKQIKVIYTPEDIHEALPKMETLLQKEILNNKIAEFMDTNAKEIYQKNLDEYNQMLIDAWTDKGKVFKYPDTYVTAQKILTNELIKIGHKNIEELMESSKELDDLFCIDK